MKISTGSAKLFYLDRNKLLKELSRLSEELIRNYSFVKGVYLLGSLARGDYRVLSDVDILMLVFEGLSRENFWKVYRQVFNFFVDSLSISFDLILILIDTERKEEALEKLKPTLLLVNPHIA